MTPGTVHVSRPLDLAYGRIMTRAAVARLWSPEAVDGLVNAGHVNVIRCGGTEMIDVRPIGDLIDEVNGTGFSPATGAVGSSAHENGSGRGSRPRQTLGEHPLLER